MIDPFPTQGIEFYKGLKVCVTGATGLIGSYAVKLLKESGAKVRAICHNRPANDFTRIVDELIQCDLGNLGQARVAVAGCDVVFGGAGITGGIGLPRLDPLSFVGPATAIVINTLHACVEEDVQGFCYLSSTTVYAPSDQPLRETDMEGEPYPLYRGIGISKRFLEKLCEYYEERAGIDVSIVRPAGAYGRFDNFDEKTSHVLPAMIERALRLTEPTFEIWGDGTDVRDFIHAQDVARCALLALAKGTDGVPLNAASGRGVTTRALAEIVLAAAGVKAEIVCRPDKPTALKTRLVDVGRAKALGFEAEISLEAGVADVVAWRHDR